MGQMHLTFATNSTSHDLVGLLLKKKKKKKKKDKEKPKVNLLVTMDPKC